MVINQRTCSSHHWQFFYLVCYYNTIGDFWLCFQTPNLRDIRILSIDSCIDTFLVHFLSPIRLQLTKSSVAEQSVRKEEEEEICAICFNTLYSGDILVRRLSQCKHVFHEECVSRAMKTRPVCPLCIVPLVCSVVTNLMEELWRITFYPTRFQGIMTVILFRYSMIYGWDTDPISSESRSTLLFCHKDSIFPNNSRGQMVFNLLQLAFEQDLYLRSEDHLLQV